MTLQEIGKQTLADGSAVKAEVSCQVVKTRENVTKAGKPYLDIEITDGTAVEKFKIWEDSDSYESFHDLEDGDCVILRGHCQAEGARRIGFGDCAGTVLPPVERA